MMDPACRRRKQSRCPLAFERMSGRFEPEKMPDKYVGAVQERVKVEQRAPEVVVATESSTKTAVINIMDALKQSMQKQGQAKARDAVRKRMGKIAPKESPRPALRSRAGARRSLH